MHGRARVALRGAVSDFDDHASSYEREIADAISFSGAIRRSSSS